jgi:threonine/homoserine/homoserine lactone efflux protein
MWGELLGVALVAIAAVVGVSAAMLQFPHVFSVLKLLGAGYLIYVGINMWQSKGKLAISEVEDQDKQVGRQQLFYQGLITAIANPKGWAFMVSLLPPFINPELPLTMQLSVLIAVILCSEFTCMTIYAAGGKTIGKLLTQRNNVKLLNKISGCLMMLVMAGGLCTPKGSNHCYFHYARRFATFVLAHCILLNCNLGLWLCTPERSW